MKVRKEMARHSSLHTRGGLPQGLFPFASRHEFSPHAWRSTARQNQYHSHDKVLSTRVEVYHETARRKALTESSLHTRGGIPSSRWPWLLLYWPSPWTWRSSVSRP